MIGDFVRQTTIGGAGDASNTIGYNLTYGVAITGTDVLTTTLAGNKIRFHTLDGVFVDGTPANGGRNTVINGVSAAEPAEISDNLQNGIRLLNATRTSSQFVKIEKNTLNGISATSSPMFRATPRQSTTNDDSTPSNANRTSTM